MSSLELVILEDIQQLRTVITRKEDEDIDRILPNLQEHLFKNCAYKQLGDERLLAEALRLLESSLGEEKKEDLLELQQHLAIVRKVHNKLFAVLNRAINLDDLLKEHLSRWPHSVDTITCEFDNEIKRQLHQVRSQGNSRQKLRSFFELYFNYLNKAGYDRFVQLIHPIVEQACKSYERLSSWNIQGLFVVQSKGEVYGLKIQADPLGTGQIFCTNRIDSTMLSASRNAVGYVRRISTRSRLWDFTWEVEREDISFEGESIGLALTIGMLTQAEGFEVDSYTAFTGYVNWDSGDIKPIIGLDKKLEAAYELGVRRVFIPEQEFDITSLKEEVKTLDIIPVKSINEVKEWLQECSYEYANTPMEQKAQGLLKKLDVELRPYGIRRVDLLHPKEYHSQAVYSNYLDKVIVNVYHSQTIRYDLSIKKSTTLSQQVKEACDNVFGSTAPVNNPGPKEEESSLKQGRTSYKNVPVPVQEQIKKFILSRDDIVPRNLNYCSYSAKVMRGNQTVYVDQYTSGTLKLEGPSALFNEVNEAIRSILGLDLDNSNPSQKKTLEMADPRTERLNAQIEAVEAIELGEYWVGTDESGKGDYYGPLVAAAVFVNRNTAAILSELGVRDSKNLTDKQNIELANKIRQVCGKRAQVVPLLPEAYNRLYSQMLREGKNLNTLLAWTHTRALENILKNFPQRRLTVIIDKFADEHYIKDKLMTEARQTELNLIQLPKAEANVAVAAASILARAQFLESLRKLSQEYGVIFPKGSSDPNILSIGKQLVNRNGQSALSKVAKLHFKTTKTIVPTSDASTL